MIRVAVVDDHYAVRLGLEAALRAQPDMTPVGAASSAAELAPLLYRTTPDVLLVDYRLPGDDGLAICLRLEAEVGAPALIVHSAFADDWLTVPALVAGAHGVVHKGASGQQLAEAIRTVADGRSALPEIAPDLLVAAGETIGPDDQPILGMLVHGVPKAEICGVLGLTPAQLRARRSRMLATMRAPAATDRWASAPIHSARAVIDDGR
jgi:DNA-binding NarL/FixJ family response regulator